MEISQQVTSGQPMTPQMLFSVAALRYIEAIERLAENGGGWFVPPQFPGQWMPGGATGGTATPPGNAAAGQQPGAAPSGGAAAAPSTPPAQGGTPVI